MGYVYVHTYDRLKLRLGSWDTEKKASAAVKDAGWLSVVWDTPTRRADKDARLAAACITSQSGAVDKDTVDTGPLAAENSGRHIDAPMLM